MPIYEFECANGTSTAKLVKVGTKTITCPRCHRKAKKILSACTFELKGGGWCADGYSNKKKEKEVSKMPRGDGTGPRGQGSGTGRGMRPRQGGRGRRGGFAAGPVGDCVCPNCGERVTHRLGQPCFEQKCPKCGETMTRG